MCLRCTEPPLLGRCCYKPFFFLSSYFQASISSCNSSSSRCNFSFVLLKYSSQSSMLIMVLNVSLCLIVIISVSSILTLTRNLLTVSLSLSLSVSLSPLLVERIPFSRLANISETFWMSFFALASFNSLKISSAWFWIS